MRMRWVLLFWLLFAPSMLVAQDRDRGIIAGLLEDSLGGEGRSVQIFGFGGALSSRATIERITISDDEGVWLTMDGLGLQWTRAALLRGRIEVQELSAEAITLERLPVAPESDLPPAEASGFALPELPVSITIDALNVTQLSLGAAVLGQEAMLAINGSGRLGNGEGAVTLDAQRTDGTLGTLNLEGLFVGDTKALELALNLTEAPNGIAARLLELPGHPSVALRLNGSGTLDDLATEITLLTDGAERLSGDISMRAVEPASSGRGPTRAFGADIGGDITALFAPQYQPFFGDEVQLKVDGTIGGDGAVSLDAMDLTTQALNLAGKVELNRDYWPVLLDIEGRLGGQDTRPILLPLTGTQTYVDSARFHVDFDQANGQNWNGQFDVDGLARDGLRIGNTSLSARGILDGNVNAIGQVTAALELSVEALDLGEPALNTAVGAEVSGKLDVAYVEGQPVKLSGLDLAGEDYALTGQAEVGAFAEGFETAFDIDLIAQDLSRFAAISGQDLSGAARLTLSGTADLGGAFDVTMRGDADGLGIGQPQADAVLAGTTALSMRAERTTEGLRLEGLDIRNPQIFLTGDAQLATDDIRLTFETQLSDAALVAPGIEGPVTISGSAQQDARGLSVDVDASGPYAATATAVGLVTGPDAKLDFTTSLPDISVLLPDYQGAVFLDGTAAQSPQGWMLETAVQGPFDLTGDVAGRVTGTDAPDLKFTMRLPDINPLVPGYRGEVAVAGTAQQRSDGWHVLVDADGPYGSEASASGRATGQNAPDVAFTAKLPDINPLLPAYRGSVSISGAAQQRGEGLQVTTNVEGPYGLAADIAGRVTGRDAPDMAFEVSLPDVRPFAPQFTGPVRAKGTAQMRGETLSVSTDATGPYGLVAQVSGSVTGTEPSLRFSARMPNIAPIVPQLSGPLQVDGTARQQGADWFVDTALQGPAGTTADVTGRVAADGRLGLNVAGNAPLALANPFLTPRNMQGQARFDLRVDGPPALGSVSGQITTADGRLSAPTLREALTDIRANIGLNNGRADLAITAAVSSGGRLSVQGPVSLTGAMPASLEVTLNALQLVDPALYRTSVDGTLQINGNLTGGARIAGRIDVGETQISVPSSGVGGFSIIPQITHVGASAAVRATQKRAGLQKVQEAAGGLAPSYPLDVVVSAPARVFVRGRGLDAELGGSLRITGTTNNIISAGRFELIRGRLDILEKRFVLDEGSIQLQGSFDPFLRFVATTTTATGTASVIIEGLASEPQVRFESSPEAPEDEVLAQIFFGRQITQLSAFQALQLASAVATLAGNGGEGIVSKLRRGFDLDDLDITTDDTGQTELTAGKYLSENIYTDVSVGGTDGPEVSINIDLSPSVTLRGSADAKGDTSIGIHFEKDY